VSRFASALVKWQRSHGRKGLPWQGTTDPYRIWLSEIMLQQTQVAAVIPYYERFLARFPDVFALAASSEDDVLKLWSGLGYYARGRNLHAAAQRIITFHEGKFPVKAEEIATLPGIGRSTAAAIAAFAFGEHAAILDGNVKRVLARHFALHGVPSEKRLWALAESELPGNNIEVYTQALMDLGAAVCTRKRPACSVCPLSESCKGYARGKAEAYPQPRPRKKRPVRNTSMLLLLREGEVLLEKRPPTGVWGGLWCFPEIQPGSEKLAGKRTLPVLRHEFTHFTLDITPVVCFLETAVPHVAEPGQIWLPVGEAIGAAVPTPVRKLLARLDSGSLLGEPAALEKALQD